MNAMTCDMEHGGCTTTATISSNLTYGCRESATLVAGLAGGFALGVIFAVLLFGLSRRRS